MNSGPVFVLNLFRFCKRKQKLFLLFEKKKNCNGIWWYSGGYCWSWRIGNKWDEVVWEIFDPRFSSSFLRGPFCQKCPHSHLNYQTVLCATCTYHSLLTVTVHTVINLRFVLWRFVLVTVMQHTPVSTGCYYRVNIDIFSLLFIFSCTKWASKKWKKIGSNTFHCHCRGGEENKITLWVIKRNISNCMTRTSEETNWKRGWRGASRVVGVTATREGKRGTAVLMVLLSRVLRVCAVVRSAVYMHIYMHRSPVQEQEKVSPGVK